MPDAPIKGSTGSSELDRAAEGTHEARLEDSDAIVIVPGQIKLARIVVEGRSYVHVSEDAAGRWVYRAL